MLRNNKSADYRRLMLITGAEDYTSVIFKIFEVRLIHIFHGAIQIALSLKIADFLTPCDFLLVEISIFSFFHLVQVS